MLIGAVRGGHVEIVRALLNKYADIDVRGQVGASLPLSPLPYWCSQAARSPSRVLWNVTRLLNAVYSPLLFLGKVNFHPWVRNTQRCYCHINTPWWPVHNASCYSQAEYRIISCIYGYTHQPTYFIRFQFIVFKIETSQYLPRPFYTRMERLPSTGQWRKVTPPWWETSCSVTLTQRAAPRYEYLLTLLSFECLDCCS